MTSAWTITAWPPATWRPDDAKALSFVHLGTSAPAQRIRASPRMGQTIWGGRAGAAAAGVSWDWIEAAEGVFVIADPMMLITNLQLLDHDGYVLTAHDAAPHLNAVVHRLPWQAKVRLALQQSDEAGAACPTVPALGALRVPRPCPDMRGSCA